MNKPYIPNHLLGERGRRNRFGFGCFKTEGADNPEKEALLNEIRGMIDEGLKNRMTKQDMEDQMKVFKDLPENFLRDLAHPQNGVLSILKRQGEELEKIKNRGTDDKRPKTLHEQVVDWHTRNKAAIDKIKTGEKAELSPLEIRVVASPMTPATVDTGASAYIPRPFIEAGVNDIPRAAPTLWDTLRKGRTGAAVYVWVNKTNAQGAAAFIAPGVLKPGVSFELATDVSNAKKIAVSAKAATELLDDIEGMVDMIEGEMRYQLLKELNSKLMTGTASSTVPAGIITLASAFTAGGLHTTLATTADVIFALDAKLHSGYLTGQTTVFMNPIDQANMQMYKTTTGEYTIPPFQSANGLNVAGVRIISDLNIPQGDVLAALLDYYVIKIYKDYTISMGWENDDFTRNLVTWVAEMRLHQIFNTAYTGAFIYDQIADIKTALNA